MSEEIRILVITAASIGFIHTLLGPDHYLPFIVMARARKWTMIKTVWITLGCGVGHVASSVVLGLLGVAMGIGVNRLVDLESVRGGIAAWLLIAFGLIYFVWGIRQAVRKRPHAHFHEHSNGDIHKHTHSHHSEHSHVHEHNSKANVTPWLLFVIFVLGPCEPLIPVLMYPAAQNSISGLVQVTTVFAITTIASMLITVVAGTWGLKFIPFGKMERYMHAMAGAMILVSGLGIQILGL